MNILVTGFFGVNNLGDDIMLNSFYYRYKEYAELTLLKIYRGGENYTPIKTENISRLKHGKSIVVDQIYSRRYDGFLWIGGTCFTDNAGDGAYRYMLSFKKRNKFIGYIGVGISELHNQDRIQMYKEILDKANIVTLRDEKSFRIARQLSNNPNIYLTEDLVYLCDEIPKDYVKVGSRRLLIAWRALTGYYDSDIEKKAVNALISFVCKHSNEFEEVIVSPLGNQIDNTINKNIYKELNKLLTSTNVRYICESNVSARIELIKSSDTVITGRLHGIFIAEWSGINTIAVGYDSKIESFLKSIHREVDLIQPNEINLERLESCYCDRLEQSDLGDWQKYKSDAEKNLHLLSEQSKLNSN